MLLCLVPPPLAAPKSFPTNVFLDFASGSVGLEAGIGSRGVVFLVFACKKQLPPPEKLAGRLVGWLVAGWVQGKEFGFDRRTVFV